MRKRKVLALLLAFSLSMGGNSMTALAAQPGVDMPVAASEEGMSAEETNLTDMSEMAAASEEEAQKEDADGAEKGPSAEAEPESPDNSAETEITVPAEDNADQGAVGTPTEEEPEESGMPTEEKPEEGEIPDVAEPSAPTETESPEELPGDSQGQGAIAPEPSADIAPDILENRIEAEEDAPKRLLPETQADVSRMVTFTDDTGMQVTYDANAEQQYEYKVDGGVLTAVTVKKDVSGNTIDTPVDFSGNVELKQPETGTRYTSIASGVFAGNTKVTYVKLPAGLETVGQEAFKGCTGLKGAYLPAGLKKIGESAFERCTSLSQIAVPKTVTEVEDDAFKNDGKLYMVYIKDADYCDLKSIGDNAFEGCSALAQFCSDTEFLLPSKLESIGKEAFKDCKAIEKIDFKKTKLREMEKGAFTGCSGLRELTLGEELTLLPEYAFSKCSMLALVNFANGKQLTIDRWAFADCYNLKQLVLPQTVGEIRDYAFQGCSKLTRVEVQYDKIKLEPEAFPVGEAAGLVIIANKPSNAYEYAKENNLWPDEDSYYKYTVEDADGNLAVDGKFPGGTVWAGTADQTDYAQNINTANKKQGVKADGVKKYYIYYSQNEGYTFDASALRLNGQPVQREDGKYYFTMPEGGAVITAGFLTNTPDTIKGTKVTVEFSEGTLLQNGATDKWGYVGVELKVGQTTRMFLLDEDGATIPASRIKQISSQNNKVATVGKNGVITAVGTGSGNKADTQIEAVVLGGDGKEIIVRRTVTVRKAEARVITLKASGYPETTSSVQLSGETDGEQTLAVTKSYVATEGFSFQLKANVYDDDAVGIGTALTWTTSDAKVAALEKKKTDESNTANTVTIPKGCEGESVIKVTAANTSVSRTFVVRVYQEGYRLKSSTVTVNPNKASTGAITLIYGSPQNSSGDTKITLYTEKDFGATKFYAEEVPGAARGNDKVFRIRPNDDETIKDGKYKVKVSVNGTKDERRLLPLTITVSRKEPKPKIKFNTKKTKFNLFYKDGRMTQGGEAASVTAEVTDLGTAIIEDVSLEPLTQSQDNQLFTDNFVIDWGRTDLSTGTVVIKRGSGNNGNLKYTSKKKAAVTGYLEVSYVNYEGDTETHVKRQKVTMPTCTKAPSYALQDPKKTYGKNDYIKESKTANLVLVDKSTKPRESVVLDAAEYTVDVEPTVKIQLTQEAVIKENGMVEVGYMPGNGKLKLILRNSSWDKDKNGKERTLSYNYTIAIK